MNKRDVLRLVKQQLRNCAGWESDEIAQDRKAALDYYFRRTRGDEVSGRSTVVAGDVSASVEANLAQMLDAFASDNIVEFDPLDGLDEEQAALETFTVTHFVMKTQNGFLQLAAAIKDALMLRNGFIKTWVEEFREVRRRTFDKVKPEALDALLAQTGGELVSQNKDSVTIKVTRFHKKFRAEALKWLYYPKTWDSLDLQECPFVCERHEDTRSELVRRGFDKAKVDKLRPLASTGGTNTERARKVRQVATPNTDTGDTSQDLVEWFEAYVLMDVDGDGISERRRVSFTWDQGTVLEDEPCYLVPYAVGVVMLNPHQVTGISQYDKLRETQDEHTGLKRALYDNVNAVTKNRLAYLDGLANPDDVGDGRPNGGIRVKRDVDGGITDIRQALMALAVPDNSGNILQNIEALKRERSELGGAALDLATGNAQIGGERMGSQGLDRAYSVMEQLAAMMTKLCAATLIRSTWLLAHATLREHYSEPVPVERNGKWETPIPAKWKQRDRVTVRIGMSPGERARQGNALRQMLNDQIALAEKGQDEVLVNVVGFYRTLMAWARTVDIRNPEQFWVNPESPNAVKAFKQKTDAAIRAANERKALMERAIGKEEAVVALDKYKHDSELQFKYWDAVLDSEVAEAQIVGDSTTKLLLAQHEPKGKANGQREPASKQ